MQSPEFIITEHPPQLLRDVSDSSRRARERKRLTIFFIIPILISIALHLATRETMCVKIKFDSRGETVARELRVDSTVR